MEEFSATVRVPRGVLKEEVEMQFGLLSTEEMEEHFHNFHDVSFAFGEGGTVKKTFQ